MNNISTYAFAALALGQNFLLAKLAKLKIFF